jgi:pimeloyl-ACP methyl ester carboxylesterase
LNNLIDLLINMTPYIYFLPGHGGRISNGLGQALGKRGFDVVGRETVGDFKKLDFDLQLETVAQDLKANFWHEDARVVANSYGGYLLLQALSLSNPFPGKLLLLSPIVGEFSSEQIRMGFIPPYAKRLYELASKGLFPAPRHCEIHVGSEDWQSIPDNVTAFATLVNAQATVVEGAGHSLPKEYVSSVLDRWL